MKYFSNKFKVGDETYDSKKEYYRYLQLQDMEKRGEISDLQRQVSFEILPKLIRYETKQLKTKKKIVERVDEKAKHYTADFVYTRKDGVNVVEDVKSVATQQIRDYPLRRHLMKMVLREMSLGDEKWEFVETK